ncbi:exported hypothetical protein [Xanthomonas phaseoli pv. phaseoli]|uniref:Secreted protein n=1 Tax=Xanthomonas campestris pv. phaseoli TaxID=317013 RepID=A0AB38DZT4_XANCH|nr:exported hypothetical protein [Xanthomonas phaseoli pv. phaseoli]SON83867.1 exported hypothetical protein [Xanthomonas phaseoli pv. phaseoli]SON88299.1 exported hypothetical protein [Xanthomonas phaseoli pv. phaseoli]SOO27464.1 exported hypothetical protein [Xanthomonas phaseoli pv. phaseoli]
MRGDCFSFIALSASSGRLTTGSQAHGLWVHFSDRQRDQPFLVRPLPLTGCNSSPTATSSVREAGRRRRLLEQRGDSCGPL